MGVTPAGYGAVALEKETSMPPRTCTYCTLRDGVDRRRWIRLAWVENDSFDFCSFYCLADWTEERELELQLRLSA